MIGDRIPYLAYLLRAGACRDLLTPAEQRDLLDSLAEHGRVLAAERNYTADNHGLFVDLGLARLTSFLPFLEQSPKWRALARERFERTLRRRLSQGIWLEHSSAYQLLAIRPLDSLINVLDDDAELVALRDEMRAGAAWLVRPDGQLTQFGDSNLEPVPDWALGQGAGVARLLRRRLRLRPRAGPRTASSATSRSPTDSTTPPTSTPTSSPSSSSITASRSSTTPASTTRTRARSATTCSPTAPTADSRSTASTCRSPTASLAYGSGLTAAGAGDGLVRDRGPQPVAGAAGRRALAALPLSPRRRPGDRRRPELRARTHLHPVPAAAPRGRARRRRRGRDADQRAGVRRRDLRRRGRQPGRSVPGARPAGAASGPELARLPRVAAALDARLRRHRLDRDPGADDRPRPDAHCAPRGRASTARRPRSSSPTPRAPRPRSRWRANDGGSR